MTVNLNQAIAAFGLGLCLASVSWVAAAADAAAGEAIVKARCTSCHNLEKLKVYASRSPEDKRVAKWEQFLPSHNLPKADERAAVIAWLVEFTRTP
jgi:cytochrome c2